MATQNLVIAGASGLIGTALLSKFIKTRDFNLRASFNNNENPIFKGKKIHYKRYDFTNYSSCVDLISSNSRVILVAGDTGGFYYRKKNPSSLTNTLAINYNLLNACVEKKASQIILFSSSTVYQNKKLPFQEDQNTLINHKSKLSPLSALYSFIEDHAYNIHKKFKIPLLILRPANVYGTHDKLSIEKANIIPSIILKLLQNKKTIQFNGDGEELRDFIFCDDLADITHKLITSSKQYYDIFNVSDGNHYKIKDVVKLIESNIIHDKKITFNFKKNMLNTNNRYLSNVKLINFIGKYKFISFKDGIKQTIKWYKAQ